MCARCVVQSTSNKEKQREASKKIERNAVKAQQKGGGKAAGKNKGMMVDDGDNDAAAKPKKWNDYTVKFTFPEPTEGNDTHLLQLIDAAFKYPGREDFGMRDMNVGIGMGSRVRRPLLCCPCF
jgi:ATP-binding cassette, subfamily F, member 1